MKIAFLNKYQNKVFRGAETFVFELSKRLSVYHEVDVISDISYLNLIKNKYDVIIPTNGRLQVVTVRIIALLTGAKVIVSGQSGIGWDDKINLLVFPDVFVALTEKSEKWAKRFNKFVNVVKIPNGVDIQKFKPFGGSFKSNLKKPVILSVGAFTEQKRMNLVIKAVSELTNASLLMIGGGGGLKNDLIVMGKELLGDRFRIESVDFKDMPGVYRSADIFTLPSASSEAFGNVLVEAMATNLPVVATNDAPRREIVGNAGLFVNPEDIDAYAAALKKAIGINWGNKPRIQSEKFSWDGIASKYEELFRSVLKK